MTGLRDETDGRATRHLSRGGDHKAPWNPQVRDLFRRAPRAHAFPMMSSFLPFELSTRIPTHPILLY